MSEIRVLSDNMINLVAAGEVVERPASVVKELIENSIDAGATKIEIEIKNGGKKLIRISDNGNGISRNDIRLAFISHATSKISKESDLGRISTLGFRGEALASISSVSKIDLITSALGESVGSSYKIEGGDEIFLKNYSLRNGTSIMVRDIFYNTPARMKFLKKDVTEGNYISSIVDHAILSHPEISFKFIRNGKLVVSSVGDGNLSSAILRVFGKDFFHSLIEVNYDLNNVRVKGFISDPLLSKSSSKMQNLFINGRWIKDKIVSNAIEAALSDEYQNNKVAFVLNLDVPYEIVDVNVHPTKTEVRFSDERLIFESVYNAIKNSLMINKKKIFGFENQIISQKLDIENKILPQNEKIPKNTSEILFDERMFCDDKQKKIFNFENQAISQKLDVEKKILPQSVEISKNTSEILCDKVVIPEISKIKQIQTEKNSNYVVGSYHANDTYFQKNSSKKIESDNLLKEEIRIIGEIFGCFFVIQHGENLILVDKHAAHERIIFENLISNSHKSCSQVLILSVTLNFSNLEYDILINNIEYINEIGYKIEDFGLGKIVVREIPAYLDEKDIQSSLCEIASFLMKRSFKCEIYDLKRIYAKIACKSAIKSGKYSSDEEIKKLVNDLIESRVTNCPHGRPIYISFTKNDIYKKFLRK